MRALVTGGGGFLGRYIAEQLVKRGDTVRTLARGDYPDLRQLGIDTIQGDIRDAGAVEAACQDMDVVFHTAAVAGIWGPWEHYHTINTEGTRRVVQACLKKGVARLVFSSSPSVTFDGSDQRNVDESAPYPDRWLCHYPHTKALAEQFVLAANGEGGLATCALRPHLIWGPRDPHLIPRLVERGRAGQLRRVGEGRNRIDVTYVENAAEAHLLAADALQDSTSSVAGRAYFISQGEPVNCWDWINEVLHLAGVPPVTRSISRRTAWWIGHAFECGHRLLGIEGEPRMTRFLAAQMSTDHYFNLRRAREDFGFLPTISTAEGLRRLGDYFADGEVR